MDLLQNTVKGNEQRYRLSRMGRDDFWSDEYTEGVLSLYFGVCLEFAVIKSLKIKKILTDEILE